MAETWYRYEMLGNHMRCETFDIIKHTPKGVWLQIGPAFFNEKKFVLKDARKRYAYPTKELAWESFKLRREWRIIHLKNQLEYSENVWAKIKDIEEPPTIGIYINERKPDLDLF